MEKEQFNNLVETLLEPKNYTTRKNPYRHADHIHRELIKLCPKVEPTKCSDCDKQVTNRVVQYVVYSLGTPRQHWKKCCQYCNEKFTIKHPFDNGEK